VSRFPTVLGAALCLSTLCCACGTRPPAAARGAPPTVPPSTAASAPPAGLATGGWHLTVYYTPVETFHGPPRKSISDCAGRQLGEHSADFLAHVQTEGFGRVVAPIQKQSYLGWNFDGRCWFMAATPVGSNDRPLRAWVSTAAPANLAAGMGVRVVSCGTDVDTAVCARVKAAAWTVDDRCSYGCTDPRHLDLYVGEEDRPHFEDQSPDYFDAHGAVVTLFG